MEQQIERLVIQVTAQEKAAIAAEAERRSLSVSAEIRRRSGLPALILLLLSCGVAAAQQGQNVSIYQGVNPNPVTIFIDPASAQLKYICTAASFVATSTSSVSSATAANPAVFTVSADHGFYVTDWPTRPRVKMTGATGNWAGLSAPQADWILVPLSTTTFTLKTTAGVDFDGTGFGALTGTVVMSSNAPRMTAPVWAIRKITYDATPEFKSQVMAYSATGGFAGNVCANRTSTALEWK